MSGAKVTSLSSEEFLFTAFLPSEKRAETRTGKIGASFVDPAYTDERAI
jgi:hypothetical protein